jgi:hypothetical protein
MGNSLTIFGRIEGVLRIPSENPDLLRKKNEEVISSLAPIGECIWPPLHREMFSCALPENFSSYKSQVIHLGASLKTSPWEEVGRVEHFYPDTKEKILVADYTGKTFEQVWIEKFEAILCRMFWRSAVVIFETDTGSPYFYEWTPTKNALTAMYATPHEPVKEWARKMYEFRGEDISDFSPE